MHSIVFKNDAVGDLVHSISAINNIVSSNEKVTVFLSKLSKNYGFLIKNPKVEKVKKNFMRSSILKENILTYF